MVKCFELAYGGTGSRDEQGLTGMRQCHKPKPFHQSLEKTETLPTATAKEGRQATVLRSHSKGSQQLCELMA